MRRIWNDYLKVDPITALLCVIAGAMFAYAMRGHP